MMRNIINENVDGDYKMWHKAPLKQDGTPIYDMTHNGGYPPDIYSYDGAKYYGANGGDWNDRECIAIIRELHNKPNALVKIYRAVPDINFEINQKKKPIGINDGDWVTINLDYAKEHGKSNLGGKFKIVSKTVKASQLYSECNSIYEYGYNV